MKVVLWSFKSLIDESDLSACNAIDHISYYHLWVNTNSNVWYGVGCACTGTWSDKVWCLVMKTWGISWYSFFFPERRSHRAVEVIAWAGVGYGTRYQLAFIRRTMNAQRHVEEVVEAHILPYLQQLDEHLYQQDNPRYHTPRTSPNRFEEAYINSLPWSPISRLLAGSLEVA